MSNYFVDNLALFELILALLLEPAVERVAHRLSAGPSHSHPLDLLIADPIVEFLMRLLLVEILLHLSNSV